MPKPVRAARLRLFQTAGGRKDRQALSLSRPGCQPPRRVSIVLSSWVLLGIMVIVCRVAGAAEWGSNLSDHSLGLDRGVIEQGRVGGVVEQGRVEKAPWSRSASNREVGGLSAPVDFDAFSEGSLALSPAAARVSLIASRNGDRAFLMVDKAHGKIILFENGRPIFSRAALTGASMADQIPPDAWNKPWAEQADVKYKVTPAGRFTITRDRDRALGDLFDINELKGRDWTIAIHQVWLGKRLEHRDARLRSPMDQDKHITDGCVDVDPSTIAELLRFLPRRGVPIYILPIDESLIASLFRTRETTSTARAPEAYLGWRWPLWGVSSPVSAESPFNSASRLR